MVSFPARDSFPFGQPVGGIVQFAFTVAEVEAGMRDFTARLGVGPWFVTGPFETPRATYRGAPTRLRLTLAIGFAGHVMVELVQQHDAVPSVYRETIERRGGHGFHHWAVGSRDFDVDLAAYCAAGYQVAFTDVAPRGNRVAYVDGGGELPGMIEIVEMTEILEARYAMMFAASQGWDGSDPVRR